MTLAVHTLDEAAAILRVKPSWLERQAAARKIPFTMLGGSYRFTTEHLIAIVALYENWPRPASPFGAKPRASDSTRRPIVLQNRPLQPRPLARPRTAA
jgi:excisionase family DNA binding protein